MTDCEKTIDLVNEETQENPIDTFIANGGFDKAFNDVFGLPQSVIDSLGEVP